MIYNDIVFTWISPAKLTYWRFSVQVVQETCKDLYIGGQSLKIHHYSNRSWTCWWDSAHFHGTFFQANNSPRRGEFHSVHLAPLAPHGPFSCCSGKAQHFLCPHSAFIQDFAKFRSAALLSQGLRWWTSGNGSTTCFFRARMDGSVPEYLSMNYSRWILWHPIFYLYWNWETGNRLVQAPGTSVYNSSSLHRVHSTGHLKQQLQLLSARVSVSLCETCFHQATLT